MHPSLPYRLGVGMMVFNQHGQVFVAKRIDTRSDAWQMPQGGIDAGEDPRTAAMRELREEIGTDHATFLAESTDWYAYDLPAELVSQIWGGKYRGQKQKWFALRLNGDDTLIDITGEHPEFCEWKWVDITTLPDLIVPFKRALYEALVQEFRHLALPNSAHV
jgi:putative (di)nucleoside polyphosphate hydrolase